MTSYTSSSFRDICVKEQAIYSTALAYQRSNGEKWVAVKATVNTWMNMCGHEEMNEAADASQIIQLALHLSMLSVS